MKTVRALYCFLFSIALAAAAPAQALTALGFDDAELSGPVFGSAHPSGVTFTVSPLGVDSSNYGADGFAGLTFITGQALDIGADHVLELAFATPVSFLQFGVAHNQPSIFGDFVPVTLFTQDGSTLDDSFSIFGGFGGVGETLYSYTASSAGAALTGLSINFPPLFASPGDKYQIDNLAFQPVPEPSTYALVIAGLLLLGCARLRGSPSGV